jgi:hypothetical protein
MNAEQIQSKFTAIGARLKLSLTADRWQYDNYAIDIRTDRHGEYFELRVPDRLRKSIDASVLQTDRRDRHLLLLVRRPEDKLDRFLCGHDERHWFVAAVPGGASSVTQAKQALRPALAQASLSRNGVPARRWDLRKNQGFRRQGEWFFVPVTASERGFIDEKLTLRNEPIRRGGGKPHTVQELVRTGGDLVYVSTRGSAILSEVRYERLHAQDPAAARRNWRQMRRNPRVFARGTVRHSDHATIALRDWHRVVMNRETETETMRNVAFID